MSWKWYTNRLAHASESRISTALNRWRVLNLNYADLGRQTTSPHTIATVEKRTHLHRRSQRIQINQTCIWAISPTNCNWTGIEHECATGYYNSSASSNSLVKEHATLDIRYCRTCAQGCKNAYNFLGRNSQPYMLSCESITSRFLFEQRCFAIGDAGRS